MPSSSTVSTYRRCRAVDVATRNSTNWSSNCSSAYANIMSREREGAFAAPTKGAFVQYLLGIDVGTTGVKAVVIRADGTVVGSATEEYPLSTPQPLWSEQNPADR